MITRIVAVIEVCLLCALCVLALPHVPDYPGLDDLQYRDASDLIPSDPSKPVRDDGLGSLLLKNLRFRDLTRRGSGLPLSLLLAAKHRTAHHNGILENTLGDRDGAIVKVPSKRQQVSVSELAQLLNNLKERNVDDGVKLQSLRFGRR